MTQTLSLSSSVSSSKPGLAGLSLAFDVVRTPCDPFEDALLIFSSAGTDLTIADLVRELAVGDHEYQSPAGPGQHSWDDFRDIAEDGDLESGAARARAPSVSPNNAEALRNRLLQVSSRLRKEVEGAGMTPVGSRRGSIDGSDTEKRNLVPSDDINLPPSATTPGFPSLIPKSGRPVDRVAFLRQCVRALARPARSELTLDLQWTSFEREQNDAISAMLGEGIAGDDELQLHKAGPSLEALCVFLLSSEYMY